MLTARSLGRSHWLLWDSNVGGYYPGTPSVPRLTDIHTALFGFLLSFYTNPWVAQSGYLKAYGAMAGIAAAALVLWLPMYVWGRHVRHVTWSWPVIFYVHWSEDREVGE
jgi:hypothetical protein